MDLSAIQHLQLEFDLRHWEHDPGLPTRRHVLLHLAKLVGKLAAYCEAAEHGESPSTAVLVEEVIPDLLIHAARLANDPQINASLVELFMARCAALEVGFAAPADPPPVPPLPDSDVPIDAISRALEGRGVLFARPQFPHDYPGDPSKNNGDAWTSDCQHGCGAWAGPSRSGGPDGVDPFGECPNHPDRAVAETNS